MNWLDRSRFSFLVIPGPLFLAAICFFLTAKTSWNGALASFDQITAELVRLEGQTPYPNEENLRQIQIYGAQYETALNALQDRLKRYVAPVSLLMAPSEFQSRLRLAVAGTVQEARARGVRLPEGFYLGFDEFASSLPSEAAAPLLGEELAEVKWILDLLIEAGVDSVTSFKRTSLRGHDNEPLRPNDTRTVQDPKANRVAPISRQFVEATFVSTPESVRTVLNRIAGVDDQFFIVRLLHIKSEQEKGPPREMSVISRGNSAAHSQPPPISAPGTKPSSKRALKFIVGDERIETTATIEMVRFNL